jgi:hypothetical protein
LDDAEPHASATAHPMYRTMAVLVRRSEEGMENIIPVALGRVRVASPTGFEKD